jgi:hypothetical protein
MIGQIHIPIYLDFHPEAIIRGAWLALGLYWLAASITKKVARKRQPSGERLFHLIYMTFAFVLLWRNDPRFGLLNNSFLPDTMLKARVGAAITVLGVAFAIWARWHIGRNWSAEVTIKKDHKLIRTGPYAHIRHPIYTGDCDRRIPRARLSRAAHGRFHFQSEARRGISRGRIRTRV